MAQVKIKGYEFNAITIRDSFNRRAQRFYNNIINSLRSVGIIEDDVEMDLEPVAIKRVPASATWYIEGYKLHYSYNSGTKYVENLYVVSKIIEFEVKEILAGEKTIEQFIFDFSESDEIEQERKDARKLLGVAEDSLDFELMSRKYKELAKDAHPDMPNGDTEKFKQLNRAHKILKRELA
jgi:hypothetical protein